MTLAIGANDGILVGDRFEIDQITGVVIDPETKQEIDKTTVKVGEFVVHEVRDKIAENAQRLNIGATVRSETTEAYTRMKYALEDAQRDLEAGRLDSARKHLDIAEAFANRVRR
jgi:hypothetical protein